MRSLLILALILTACSAPPSAPRPPAPTAIPLEYKLATIERGQPADPADPIIAGFRDALDDLGAKCTDSREHISDMAVAAHEEIKKRTGTDDLLATMTNLEFSMASVHEPIPCAPRFASYVVEHTRGH